MKTNISNNYYIDDNFKDNIVTEATPDAETMISTVRKKFSKEETEIYFSSLTEGEKMLADRSVKFLYKDFLSDRIDASYDIKLILTTSRSHLMKTMGETAIDTLDKVMMTMPSRDGSMLSLVYIDDKLNCIHVYNDSDTVELSTILSARLTAKTRDTISNRGSLKVAEEVLWYLTQKMNEEESVNHSSEVLNEDTDNLEIAKLSSEERETLFSDSEEMKEIDIEDDNNFEEIDYKQDVVEEILGPVVEEISKVVEQEVIETLDSQIDEELEQEEVCDVTEQEIDGVDEAIEEVDRVDKSIEEVDNETEATEEVDSETEATDQETAETNKSSNNVEIQIEGKSLLTDESEDSGVVKFLIDGEEVDLSVTRDDYKKILESNGINHLLIREIERLRDENLRLIDRNKSLDNNDEDSELLEENEKLKDTINELEKKLEDYYNLKERIKVLEIKESECDSLNNRLNNLQTELEDCNVLKSKIQELQNELSEYDEIKEKAQSLENELNSYKSRVDDYDILKSKYDDAIGKVSKVEEEYESRNLKLNMGMEYITNYMVENVIAGNLKPKVEGDSDLDTCINFVKYMRGNR